MGRLLHGLGGRHRCMGPWVSACSSWIPQGGLRAIETSTTGLFSCKLNAYCDWAEQSPYQANDRETLGPGVSAFCLASLRAESCPSANGWAVLSAPFCSLCGRSSLPPLPCRVAMSAILALPSSPAPRPCSLSPFVYVLGGILITCYKMPPLCRKRNDCRQGVKSQSCFRFPWVLLPPSRVGGRPQDFFSVFFFLCK